MEISKIEIIIVAAQIEEKAYYKTLIMTASNPFNSNDIIIVYNSADTVS